VTKLVDTHHYAKDRAAVVSRSRCGAVDPGEVQFG
jgi:hypothetical protein